MPPSSGLYLLGVFCFSCLSFGVQAISPHHWLVPLVHLSSFDYLFKEQATSLACTLKATKCTSLYLFTAENLHKSKKFCTFASEFENYGKRRTFVDHYMKPAWGMGLIDFAYPNSPTKPEQAYKLTPKGLELLATLEAETEN